jgi:nucleoside-diphosphate-sugar epimerase
MPECILVTGSSGFLGAWVVRDLLSRGIPLVIFDRDPDLRRLDDLIPNFPAQLKVVSGDISDLATVRGVMETHGVTAVIHLAGLQIPTCKVDPLLGARVNVLGTLAVFEAARQLGTVRQIVYASSAAVIGREEDYAPGIVSNDAVLKPATHYGVFKLCNEGNARVYFDDHGISSVGLRPWTVYGLGRDQGVTSDATQAIKAAWLGKPFAFRYAGRNAVQYAGDVAAVFVMCALDQRKTAATFNLRGEVVEMRDYIAAIETQCPQSRGLLSLSGDPIPVACDLDDRDLRAFLPHLPATPLADGIRETIEMFEQLRQRGRLA